MTRAATMAIVVARMGAAAYFLLTAIYALLVYLPFSYQQFILPDVVPGIAVFVAWHRVLFWIVLAALAAASIADLRNRATRMPTALFLGSLVLTGAYVSAWGLVAALRSDRSSLVVCLAALVPVLWMSALDLLVGRGLAGREGPPRRASDESPPRSATVAGDDRPLFAAAVFAALFVSMIYFGIAALRQAAPEPGLHLAIALSATVVAHGLVFGALFLALVAIRGSVVLAGGSAVHTAVLGCLLATALTAGVFKTIVFAAISFTGPIATIVATAFALAVVGLVAGMAMRLHAFATPRPWWGAVALTGIAAIAWLLAVRTAMLDWNYLLQKTSAIVVWAAAFGVFHATARASGAQVAKTSVVWLLLGAAVPAVAYRALDPAAGDTRAILDAHAGIDPSFKVIYDLVGAPSTGAAREFYDLLQRNTNIPRAVPVAPVAINLVDALAPRGTAPSDRAPNVFIFVIDSLRQDYVSPYNLAVTFTPAIGAFARDSVVFTRAFTRYGATGLSEPSIWAGALLVHKQYVLPFAPMNALQKLLAADGYQRFVSRDTILRTLMVPDDMDVELDAGVANMDYDLCRSLTDLQSKILDPARPDRPIFAYTQPQNIHISRITREEGGAPGGRPYSGFYAPYAARIQKIDACFGQFVQFLRDQHLYDDSVIVLTSDHGDSLGEGGRWGHAYTIFPEILRIPLLMHLPRALAAGVTCDTEHVASLVDITPSLYYLLGHRPVAASPIFGRPLCTVTPAEQAATRRDSYMVVSSYGPVYGVLRDNGRWLYIADGVNYTDYYYDLTGDPTGSKNLVTPAVRLEQQPLIREGIEAINGVYRPGPPAFDSAQAK